MDMCDGNLTRVSRRRGGLKLERGGAEGGGGSVDVAAKRVAPDDALLKSLFGTV